ncbi:MAG: hypothetical protein IPL20_17500 [Saprospiraceae bacterium]|nr:hypothetical protein [Saprospiraceae bacterium]
MQKPGSNLKHLRQDCTSKDRCFWNSHIRLETAGGGDYGNILYDGNMKFRNFGAETNINGVTVQVIQQ